MRRVTALLACAAVALSACGGPSKEDAKTTVRDYLAAFAQNDGQKVCDLMASDTRAAFLTRMELSTNATDCAQAVEQRRKATPKKAIAVLKRVKLTGVKVDGKKASVKVKVGRITTTTRLKAEGDHWRVTGAPGS